MVILLELCNFALAIQIEESLYSCSVKEHLTVINLL
jgi:hypothetical protein